MELQRHLIALGHLEGEVDGIIGSGTLGGVRSYQRAKGMPVDGYPTQTILKKLRADAPAIAPAAASQSTGSLPTVPGVAAPAPSAQPQGAASVAVPANQAAIPQAMPQLPAPAQPLAAQPQVTQPQATQPQTAQPPAAQPSPLQAQSAPTQAIEPEYSPPGQRYGYAIIPVQPRSAPVGQTSSNSATAVSPAPAN